MEPEVTIVVTQRERTSLTERSLESILGDRSQPFRLIYIAKLADAIYVLHVFQKKTEKTSPLDVALARTRLASVRRSQSGG